MPHSFNEASVWHTASHSVTPPYATHDDCFHETLCLGGNVQQRVYSVDLFNEGVHFDSQHMEAKHIAWRCLAASLSDIASCGATPTLILNTLGLPPWVTPAWITAYHQGLRALLDTLGLGNLVVGGDTTASPHLTLSHTVMGVAPVGTGRALPHRQAGQGGSVVAVVGQHGLSSLGLACLKHLHLATVYPQAWRAFHTPVPLLKAGQAVARLRHTHPAGGSQAIAMMDTSDGLADACLRLAQQSRLNITLYADRLHLHPELTHAEAEGLIPSAEQALLYGGEDFGLVALIPHAVWQQHQTSLIAEGWQAVGETEHQPPDLHVPSPSAGWWQAGQWQAFHTEKTFQHFNHKEAPQP